jgi:hypothetical protein
MASHTWTRSRSWQVAVIGAMLLTLTLGLCLFDVDYEDQADHALLPHLCAGVVGPMVAPVLLAALPLSGQLLFDSIHSIPVAPLYRQDPPPKSPPFS